MHYTTPTQRGKMPRDASCCRTIHELQKIVVLPSAGSSGVKNLHAKEKHRLLCKRPQKDHGQIWTKGFTEFTKRECHISLVETNSLCLTRLSMSLTDFPSTLATQLDTIDCSVSNLNKEASSSRLSRPLLQQTSTWAHHSDLFIEDV